MSKMCSVFNIFSSPEAGGGVDKYLVFSSASSACAMGSILARNKHNTILHDE